MKVGRARHPPDFGEHNSSATRSGADIILAGGPSCYPAETQNVGRGTLAASEGAGLDAASFEPPYSRHRVFPATNLTDRERSQRYSRVLWCEACVAPPFDAAAGRVSG
jgi:hypothetical protein